MFDIPPDLNKPFPPGKVKKNPKGFDYVGIEDYIERLNEVLGSRWSWEIRDHNIQYQDIPPTGSGKMQFMVTLRGTLSIVFLDLDVVRGETEDDEDFLTTSSIEVKRDGIGAAVSFDPDMAVKTAQAEALKKACHQFGIALYLWHEEERDFVTLQKKAQVDDSELKRLAVVHTQRTLDIPNETLPTAEQVASVLDLSVDDLKNPKTLRDALVMSGVI